jgi:hypothetical protein
MAVILAVVFVTQSILIVRKGTNESKTKAGSVAYVLFFAALLVWTPLWMLATGR